MGVREGTPERSEGGGPVPAAAGGGGAELGGIRYGVLCKALPGTELGERNSAPGSTSHATTTMSMAGPSPQPHAIPRAVQGRGRHISFPNLPSSTPPSGASFTRVPPSPPHPVPSQVPSSLAAAILTGSALRPFPTLCPSRHTQGCPDSFLSEVTCSEGTVELCLVPYAPQVVCLQGTPGYPPPRPASPPFFLPSGLSLTKLCLALFIKFCSTLTSSEKSAVCPAGSGGPSPNHSVVIRVTSQLVQPVLF